MTKKPKIKHLQANSNANGIIGLSYVTDKKFSFFAIGNDGEILMEKECINRNKYKIEPKGAIAVKKHFLHFFYSPQSKQTYGLINILDRKIVRPFPVQPPNSAEIIIGEIFGDSTYYRVSINKNQEKLILRKFLINELKFKATYFDLSIKTVKAINKLFKTNNFLDASPKSDIISVIESGDFIEPSLAKKNFKLYQLSENEIALTIDGKYSTKPNNTELLIFNWETGKKEQHYFGQSTILKDASIANSLIYQKNLYHLSITADYLYLAIYEMELNQLVKSYFYQSSDEEISIMSSNLLFKNENAFKT